MTNLLIVAIAQYAIFLLPIIMLIVFFRLDKKHSIEYALAFIFACLFGFLGIKFASSIFYDPRPFVASGVIPLFAHAADNGFPSDHATFSVIMATVTTFYSRKVGILMLLVAGMIGAARVFAHVHSWIDILGGIIVGVATSVFAVLLSKYIIKKAFSRQLQSN
jgi:undecaprenyl-diphosphatase